MSRIDPHCGPRESAPVARAARLAVWWWLVPAVAAGQQNLGFEDLDDRGVPSAWSAAGSAVIESDASVVAVGRRSLKLTRSSAGLSRVVQRVEAAAVRAGRGPQRVRLSGLVRSGGGGAAALWLRIDGGGGPLFLDSFGDARDAAGEAVAESSPGTEASLMPAGAPAPEAPADWRRYEIELPLPEDVEGIAFGVSLRGAGSAWFDGLSLEAAGLETRPPAAPAAARYLDAALALMREHALRRAAIDWPALRSRALEHARGAVTARDAHPAVRFAIRELGDRHSYLQSPGATRALETTAVSNARTGSPAVAPRSQRLVGNLAYLHVPSFAGGTPVQQVEFAEQLKSAIQLNDSYGICGWVVDLRENPGGNLWPMLAGLGPLLGEGELAASVYPDGRRVPIWYRDGQAGFGDYTQLRVLAAYRPARAVPVAVLQGAATASSAEVLAVAFRGRTGTRSFGGPTRGLSAGNRTFPLADGASLVLTVAGTSDTRGQLYAGPIPPDEEVGGGRNSSPEALDLVLEAATAWLAAHDGCH